MSDTLLTRLRERRAALGAARTTDLDVPGYDGAIVVRYKWVPYEEMAKAGRKLAKIKDDTRQQLAAAADTLVMCCESILLRVEDDLQPLAEHFGDEALGEALGFEAETARRAVFELFRNDYAVLQQAVEVSAWLQGESPEVDEEFAGN